MEFIILIMEFIMESFRGQPWCNALKLVNIKTNVLYEFNNIIRGVLVIYIYYIGVYNFSNHQKKSSKAN